MIEENNSAIAVGKHQPRAQSKFLALSQSSLGVSRAVPRLTPPDPEELPRAVPATTTAPIPTEITGFPYEPALWWYQEDSPQPQNPCGGSGGVRLILVPLVCAAMLSLGASRTWAAASSALNEQSTLRVAQIRYKDSYVLQFVSQVSNPDGSSDQVYSGTGTGNPVGGFSIVAYVHVEPGYYDPVSNSSVTPFTGSETVTASNGDTLLSTFNGTEVAPLPPSPPFRLSGSQTITGGTGRFSGAAGSLKFTGSDNNQGTISVTTTGTISLLIGPVVVLINDLDYPNAPEVDVYGAQDGYDFCPCANLGVISPTFEVGGLITLFGVDTFGSINEPGECGWRFLDPSLPAGTCHSAVDIVWIQHDYNGPFYTGDLQVAFNSALPGNYYANPAVCPQFCDVSLGPLTYEWQLVYADKNVVVLFKAQKPKKHR